jgi:S1-C subfamily serine protease
LSETRGTLVLQVAPGSLAAASGLEAGDVIIEAAADEFSSKERIDDAPALLSLYSARRWRGSQEVIVIRNQKPLPLKLRFTKE